MKYPHLQNHHTRKLEIKRWQGFLKQSEVEPQQHFKNRSPQWQMNTTLGTCNCTGSINSSDHEVTTKTSQGISAERLTSKVQIHF